MSTYIASNLAYTHSVLESFEKDAVYPASETLPLPYRCDIKINGIIECTCACDNPSMVFWRFINNLLSKCKVRNEAGLWDVWMEIVH